MKIGSLFSGCGGLDMAVESVFPGARPAWFCEWDDAPSRILAHHWPDVPNLRDVTAVDWSAVEPVDIITGGFPCQDVSHAGRRQGLIRDGEGRTRSGLWGQMLRAIDTIRPPLVVAENVRGLLSATADSDVEPCPWCMGDGGASPMRALGAVLADLADIGFDASWTSLRASDVGAAHGRFRVFILAWPVEDVPVAVADSEVAGHSRAGERSGRGSSVGHEAVGGSRDRRCEGDAPNPGREHGEQGREVEGSLVVRERSGQPERSAAPAPDAPHHGLTWSREARDGRAGSADGSGRNVEWGVYAPAVRRWERLTRSAPAPTEPNTKGKPRLNTAFVEWLMGLPAGHVTDPAIGLTRNQQLKALGNGVVPQQGAAALEWLLSVEAVTA